MNFQEVIKQFIDWDHQLFTNINSTWASPLFDMYFPNITDLHKNHLALLFLVLGLAVWIFRQRTRALKGILVLTIAVAASDLVSYRVVKPLVHRTRPPATQGVQVQLRTDKFSGNSFPSNHAANIFAIATIVTLLYPPYFLISFLIAISIAYSRVYVGVHFPSDVVGGAIIGYLVAKIVWSFLGYWVDRMNYEEDNSTRSRFYFTRHRDGKR